MRCARECVEGFGTRRRLSQAHCGAVWPREGLELGSVGGLPALRLGTLQGLPRASALQLRERWQLPTAFTRCRVP